MAGKTKESRTTEIQILKIKPGQLSACLLGVSPLIMNRLHGVTMQELLYPAAKKNIAGKASTLKHDPLMEYRNSVYRSSGKGATELAFPAVAFKKAMCSAALDMPGAKKSEIGRRIYVQGESVDIYGIPQMYMATVRQAGIGHAPDIRTRAILSRWAAWVTVQYNASLLNSAGLANLLAAAGLYIGIGDGRGEKGTFNFGQFELVNSDNPEFGRLLETGGREPQLKALEDPDPYDEQTAELWSWFVDERRQRETEALRCKDQKEKRDAEAETEEVI